MIVSLQKDRTMRPGAVERRKRDIVRDVPAGSSYFDHKYKTTVHKINEGDFCVLSRSEHIIMTTLGSCISVCIYDPAVRVGGMNHFLLPRDRGDHSQNSISMRYGNNAMEILINEILKRGGKKSRLKLKAFGAGNVLKMKANIGEKNQAFLRKYIMDEGLDLECTDLGGNLPRRVLFFPATGRALVKQLKRASDHVIGQKEEEIRQKIEQRKIAGDIELF